MVVIALVMLKAHIFLVQPVNLQLEEGVEDVFVIQHIVQKLMEVVAEAEDIMVVHLDLGVAEHQVKVIQVEMRAKEVVEHFTFINMAVEEVVQDQLGAILAAETEDIYLS
jgi:DNA-binding transcriptional regulator WhiA